MTTWIVFDLNNPDEWEHVEAETQVRAAELYAEMTDVFGHHIEKTRRLAIRTDSTMSDVYVVRVRSVKYDAQQF